MFDASRDMVSEFVTSFQHLLIGGVGPYVFWKGGCGGMGSNAGFHEKMDALDLIINALMAHEKRLDAISHRLEGLGAHLSAEGGETVRGEGHQIPSSAVEKSPHVVFKKWSEYAAGCRGAKMVAFQLEGNFFRVYAVGDGGVFAYEEELPEKRLRVLEGQTRFSIDKTSLSNIDYLQFLIDGRLKCGLSLSIEGSRTPLNEKGYLIELSYGFEADEVKEFLSRELSVAKGRIVEGKITF